MQKCAGVTHPELVELRGLTLPDCWRVNNILSFVSEQSSKTAIIYKGRSRTACPVTWRQVGPLSIGASYLMRGAAQFDFRSLSTVYRRHSRICPSEGQEDAVFAGLR